MIEFQTHSEGTLLPVRAHPGASQNKIGGVHDGSLRIAVTAVSEYDKANLAIISLLSKALDIAKSDIELIRGAASRQKTFLLRDIEPEIRLLASESVSEPAGENVRPDITAKCLFPLPLPGWLPIIFF